MSTNKNEWRIGFEWFKNESEKEFDGVLLLKGDSAESLALEIPKVVAHINQIAESYLTDTILVSSLIPTKMTPELATMIRNKLVWYHIMHKPTLDKMPKTMFEKQHEDFSETEKSFEQIMSETSVPPETPQQVPEHDLYFTCDGAPLPGIPDFWALQAGIL